MMSAQKFRIAASANLEPLKLLGGFLLVFFFSYLFLELIGFVPEERQAAAPAEVPNGPEVVLTENGTVAGQNTQTATAGAADYTESYNPANPRRIIIDKIGVNMPVKNPESTNIAVLDNALLSGAVRYPGSARFGEDATMFLFGHSSYLPIVHNQAFRAFNDIQNLKQGDVIRVQSATSEYVYRVTSVKKENLAEAYVALERGEKKLILATCDSFGKTSDRFIVEAVFAAEYPL
jgi:LPXTG-site transpeptidase (sortase) family protein